MTRRPGAERQNYQSHSVTKRVKDAKTTHFASGRHPKLFTTLIKDLAVYLPYMEVVPLLHVLPRSQSRPS